jgi:hypothetical protein
MPATTVFYNGIQMRLSFVFYQWILINARFTATTDRRSIGTSAIFHLLIAFVIVVVIERKWRARLSRRMPGDNQYYMHRSAVPSRASGYRCHVDYDHDYDNDYDHQNMER